MVFHVMVSEMLSASVLCLVDQLQRGGRGRCDYFALNPKYIHTSGYFCVETRMRHSSMPLRFICIDGCIYLKFSVCNVCIIYYIYIVIIIGDWLGSVWVSRRAFFPFVLGFECAGDGFRCEIACTFCFWLN